MAVRIKRNDIVQVIRGDRKVKGQRGKVLRVEGRKDRVVVENLNYVYKHLRRSQEHPRGGRVEREAPLDISNVMLVCPGCNRATRVGNVTEIEGGKPVKRRQCKKCGNKF